jgi:hypothetical protein
MPSTKALATTTASSGSTGRKVSTTISINPAVISNIL